MKYAFCTHKGGYQSLDYRSNIEYNNDILYFKHIVDMYRHLYYAPTNKFELLADSHVILNRKYIKEVVANNGKVKPVLKSFNIRYICYYLVVLCYIWFLRLTTSTHPFYPTLKRGFIGQEIVYILDGFVINGIDFTYNSSIIHADSDLSKFSFNHHLSDEYAFVDVAPEPFLLNSNVDKIGYSIFEQRIVRNTNTPKVYVYDMESVEDGVVVSVLLQGYQYFENEFVIDTTNKYSILKSTDWQYYNKNAYHFKTNFIKLKLETYEDKINFRYNGRLAIVYLTRHLGHMKIYNDLVIDRGKYSIRVDAEIDKYKNEYYSKMEKLKVTYKDEIYLFSDRQDKADDNAEALYRYYQQHTDREIYFALSKECECWDRLNAEGFNLVEFGSEQHGDLYLLASKVISSHAARRVYDPFFPKKDYCNLETFKFVFLQHGIIMGNHNGFLDIVNNPLDLVIASTEDEANIIRDFSGYNNVVVTGLARYDNYNMKQVVKKPYIIYAPSWNTKYKDNLAESDYKNELEKVLNSRTLYEILNSYNLDIHFILHPEFINENIELANKYNYTFMEQGQFVYSEELKNCTGLITDYSSLFFDVIYQRKFVVHHQPYELHHQNDRLTGYQDAVYKTDEISQLEMVIAELATNNFQIGSDKEAVISNFFKFNDNEFCHRNYQAIEKL